MKTRTERSAAVKLWVYKCNRNPQEYSSADGDWEEVFSGTSEVAWGGSRCTRNPVSKSIINERMRKGDLVLAYQTNERSIVGVCGLTNIIGEWDDRHLYLKPLHRFEPPVLIHELKLSTPSLRRISAFTGCQPQTIYDVPSQEIQLLERACGIKLAVGAFHPRSTKKIKKRGACFGDSETNRKVERAAVRAVTDWYGRRGWIVDTVEPEKCGYDLECRLRQRVEHVEVKGVAGSEPCFNITVAELAQAERNSAFIICIVTSTLSNSPEVLRLTGSQLRDQFHFRPLQFHATRVPIHRL